MKCKNDNCDNDILNPTPSSKWCPICAKEKHKQQMRNYQNTKRKERLEKQKKARENIVKKLALEEINQDPKQEKLHGNTTPTAINPYYLTRGLKN